MQPSSTSILVFASILSFAFPSQAEILMGEFSSDYGLVNVEENIANPSVPTHLIVFNALEGSSSAGNLVFRCKDNKTEVFYYAAEFEFFGVGSSPDISTRFASESASKKLPADVSSGVGQSAFIRNPIGFITKFRDEQEVVLSGFYYAGSFAALFKADDLIIDAIYDMATTCNWVDKLPVRENSVIAAPSGDLSANDTQAAISAELSVLVEKYGLKAVEDAFSAMNAE